MKKILLWGFCILFVPVVNAQEVLSSREYVRRAGPYEVKQANKGILPYIIFQGKRSVSVFCEAVFDSPFDQIRVTKNTAAAIRRSQELAYGYFISGWQAWRSAANAYLPKKYQLPELSFTFSEDVSNSDVADDSGAAVFVHLAVRFPATSLEHLGQYTSSSVNRIELVLPIHLLKYLAFTDTDPLRRKLMEGEYRNMICNLVGGPNTYWDKLTLQGTALENVQWHNRYRPLEEAEEKCLDELTALPAKDWTYKGPFAVNNQHTMTHEWGHFFGFGHMDNSIMATGDRRDATFAKPVKNDGLRLATLVCWHYNRQAGKEVCVPQVKTPF